MLDLRSGLPFHWIRNGLPYLYPTLEGGAHCDVLVIGGGITGALCGHACAVAGLDVLVVEARSVATGSTSASTALLQYELDTPLHELAERVGEAAAARSYRLCAEAVEQLLALAHDLGTCDAVPRQSLQYASTPGDVEGLRREAALRARHGLRVELLDAKEVKARLGFRKPAALLSHLAGEVDPCRFTHLLLQEVLRRGGRVVDRTHAEHIGRNGTGFEAVTTRKHRIRAAHVVLATGYAIQQQMQLPGGGLHSTYAVASERLPQDGERWYRDCLIWETARPYLYLRTTRDGRILLGGLDEPFRDPHRRDRLLERKTRRLVRAFHKLFPHIPFVPEYAWCGTFGDTVDGLPYIDRDPATGAWVVLGMGGNGITFSQVGAMLVRDAILGRPHADAALFRLGR